MNCYTAGSFFPRNVTLVICLLVYFFTFLFFTTSLYLNACTGHKIYSKWVLSLAHLMDKILTSTLSSRKLVV